MPDLTAPTEADLAAAVPAKRYAQLGGAVAGALAVKRAVRWLQARFLRHGAEVEWTDITVEATLKRAEYELWARSERDDVARDKRDDANDLLEGFFGPDYDGGATDRPGSSGDGRGVATAATAPPPRSPLLDRYGAANGLGGLSRFADPT